MVPVSVPREVALKLARMERDALWRKGRGSTNDLVKQATVCAEFVVRGLERGDDQRAIEMALRVGELWEMAEENGEQ